MRPGRRILRVAVSGVAALAAGGCLGSGARRVDAPCREMRASVAREMLRDSPEIPVLDVRTSRSIAVRGAILVPLTELEEQVPHLGRYRSTPVVVIGDDGPAAHRACEVLSGAGFKYVIFVPEGAEGLFTGVRGGIGPDGNGRGQR